MTDAMVTVLSVAGDVLVAAAIAVAVALIAAVLFGGRDTRPLDECYGVRLVRDEDDELALWETDRDALDDLYAAIGTTR